METLTALHDSAFSTWIRESESVWAFPTVLTVHTLGMMLLVGSAWVVDLRLLGVARTVPLGPLRPLFRIMWAAFWINFVTGVLLFIADPERKLFGLQFHPEVVHTEEGKKILHNFLFTICGCRGEWTMASFIEESARAIKQTVGSARVVLGLSGGVDSSAAALLAHKAIGDQLTCVFVDNGLLRSGEREQVEETFGKHFHMRVDYVDASARFLKALSGVSDPEQKRKIIGREFVAVFGEAPEPVRVSSGARQLAAASAMLWAGAIFTGRLLGYM